MKKHYAYILSTSLLIISSGLSAMVKDPLFVEFELVRSGIASAHNDAFANGPQQGRNLFNAPINTAMWDNALSVMERFVTKIVNQNKGWFSGADTLLIDSLSKVVNDGHGLARNIKLIKDTLMNKEALKDPMRLVQALGTIKNIQDNMIAVQKELQPRFLPAPSKPLELACNAIYTTATFIEVTAQTAIKDASIKSAEIMKEARNNMMK
jgi:hypothetical protein